MRRAFHRRSGLTTIELLVSSALLSATAGTILLATQTSSRAFRINNMVAELDTKVGQALDEIGRRLKASSIQMVNPIVGSPLHTSWVDFQSVVGYVGGNPVWGPPERIQLEYSPGEVDDGVDNDGNGLIDECRVVWIENPGVAGERQMVICNWVSESLEGEVPGNAADDNGNFLDDEQGFSIDFDVRPDYRKATVRLTLQRAGADPTR